MKPLKEYLLDHINSNIKDADDKLKAISETSKRLGISLSNSTSYFEAAAEKRTLIVIKHKLENYENNSKRS